MTEKIDKPGEHALPAAFDGSAAAYTELEYVKYSRPFWVDLADRAISSAAGAAIATLGASAVGLLSIDYATLGSIAGGAALVSVLKALAVRASKEV